MLQNYIQLYVTLTKLYHISTIDHLVSFYISLVKCRKKLQYHCNSKPISSILKKIAAVRYIRLSKIKTLTLRQVLETNMHRSAKFHQKWSNSCRDMVIQRFSKWRPSAILDVWNLNFLTVTAVKKPILHHRTKFCEDQSNRCGDIAILWFWRRRLPPSWTLKNSKLSVHCRGLLCVNVPNFQNRSNSCRDMAI